MGIPARNWAKDWPKQQQRGVKCSMFGWIIKKTLKYTASELVFFSIATYACETRSFTKEVKRKMYSFEENATERYSKFLGCIEEWSVLKELQKVSEQKLCWLQQKLYKDTNDMVLRTSGETLVREECDLCWNLKKVRQAQVP